MKVAVIFADGFEDIEAITPFDLLKRANIEVVSLGLSKKNITSKSGLKIETDDVLDENHNTSVYDAVVLPGGLKGAQNIRDSKPAKDFVVNMIKTNKKVGAICASPALALASYGILDGKKFTCYPGMESNVNGGKYINESVVIDENIITSKGVGTSIDFSYQLILSLTSKEVADKVFADAVISQKT